MVNIDNVSSIKVIVIILSTSIAQKCTWLQTSYFELRSKYVSFATARAV